MGILNSKDDFDNMSELERVQSIFPLDSSMIPFHQGFDFQVSCNELDKLQDPESVKHMAKYYLLIYMYYRHSVQNLARKQNFSFLKEVGGEQ